MKKRKEITTEKFEQHFDEIFYFVNNNSPQNAMSFAEKLNDKIETIKKSPEIFPKEPYLPTKQNWYRFALVMKSWKVIYKVTNNMLVLLGIIHTARHPKEIKKLRTKNYK